MNAAMLEWPYIFKNLQNKSIVDFSCDFITGILEDFKTWSATSPFLTTRTMIIRVVKLLLQQRPSTILPRHNTVQGVRGPLINVLFITGSREQEIQGLHSAACGSLTVCCIYIHNCMHCMYIHKFNQRWTVFATKASLNFGKMWQRDTPIHHILRTSLFLPASKQLNALLFQIICYFSMPVTQIFVNTRDKWS